MEKFTTPQLLDAIKALYSRADEDSTAAYQLAFDEAAKRLGDDEFDKWWESNVI